MSKSKNEHHLGVAEMDRTHDEFLSLVAGLQLASKNQFVALFSALVDHTKRHFEDELKLMENTKFPAIKEHREEHVRVLSDLKKMNESIAKGSTLFAKAYVSQQLPSWFNLHLSTMDAALAKHVKEVEKEEHVV